MLLFLDESGTDHVTTPYEVLAGVAISETSMWPLIQAVRTAERNHFGMLLSDAEVEPKGTSLLKSKMFRFASQGSAMTIDKRTPLAKAFLSKSLDEKHGHHPQYFRDEYTAYGQAVIGFVRQIYSLCHQYNVKVFASIVSQDAPRSQTDFLRKDYAYLFERFYYYLEDIVTENSMGLLVFDERDKNFCKRLCAQMEAYFNQTGRGQLRSSKIVPEPFFVHSDITTAVQVADIVAYSLNWGLRLNKMKQPTRAELEEFGQLALGLQYIGYREGNTIYGIKYLDDLRPRSERNS
jgi:hypothetical protein